jgi:hypothetical protein
MIRASCNWGGSAVGIVLIPRPAMYASPKASASGCMGLFRRSALTHRGRTLARKIFELALIWYECAEIMPQVTYSLAPTPCIRMSFSERGSKFKVQSPVSPSSISKLPHHMQKMFLIPHPRASDAPLRVPMHHPCRSRPEHVVVGVDGLFWLITAAAVRGPAWRASRGGV